MEKIDIENPERRSLLRAMPVAAMAGLALGGGSLFAARAAAQAGAKLQIAEGSVAAGGGKFLVVEAPAVEQAIENLKASQGNQTLYTCDTFTLVLTSEKDKSAKEFEWHEHRDHVFHILDGATTYELGGTPQNAHSTKPGEWLAPASDGATTITLKQGEFLVIPRGTPHRRTTKESVLFALFSPQGA
jgi:mannose-6-phosphate isomerase-like protein (cupin superfamily)